MAKLNAKEKDILKSVDAGEWDSVRSKKKDAERYGT